MDSLKRIISITYIFIGVLFLTLLFSVLIYNDIEFMKTGAQLRYSLDKNYLIKSDEDNSNSQLKLEIQSDSDSTIQIGPSEDTTEDTTEIEETTKIVTKPSGNFIYPTDGAVISGKVEIKFNLADAYSVEFYLTRINSLSEIYLGRIDSKENASGYWNYIWDTNSTPNGSYYLISQIKNKFGIYKGDRIHITVKNEVIQQTKTIETLKQKIIEEETLIQDQEQRLIVQNQQIAQEVAQDIQSLSNETQNLISPENQNLTQQKLNELTQEITTQQIKSQNEIQEKVEEINKLVSESSSQEEAKNFKKKLEETINESLQKNALLAEEKKKIEESKQTFLAKDSDDDGITDKEELRLGTDPFNSDTDQDGFFDGSEISLGTDPLTVSPADKIQYQTPIDSKPSVSDLYEVRKVEIIVSKETQKKVLKIQGKAPPHTFVTIYIYSLPIIVVAKADAEGNWEYILDKSLADGRHSVYAAVTNTKGEIEKSSAPFDFVKTEDKIVEILALQKETTESPAESFHRIFIVMIITTILTAIVFVLIILGIYIRKNAKIN